MASDRRKAIVITALQSERAAVIEHLSGVIEETHPRGSVYRRGIFDERSEPWDVLVAEIGAGNENAAAEAQRAIEFFDPEVALFVGIAGAIKDLDHGSVVASSEIYNYESGKDRDDIFEIRPKVELPGYSLLQRARHEAGEPDWRSRIKPSPGSDSKAIDQVGILKTPPIARIGPIAAGAKLLASTRSKLYEFLRANYNDAVAVEMEGYGFLRAVYINQPVQGIIIRGISDRIGDKNAAADGFWQPIAARHAAAFAFQVLAKLDRGGGNRQAIGFEREQRLNNMFRASIARCAERWQAIGVDRDTALEMANDPALGATSGGFVPSDEQPLRVIIGEIGIGKSLRAERWHQQAILRVQLEPRAPIPVYIEAKEEIADLEAEIDRHAEGLGDWRTRGTALSLDRLECAGIGGVQ
jgi:nucleoside phosphorylase